MPPGARDASLRRLLRRLEQQVELPRPRPRAPAHRLRAPRRGGDVPVTAPPPSARWRASRPSLASRPAPPMAGKQSELMPTSPSLSREQLVDVELVHDGARVPPGDTLR